MLYGTPLVGAKNTEEFGELLPTHLLDVIYTNFEPLKINEKNVVQINEDELPRFLPEIDKIIKDGKYATQTKLVNVANRLVAYLPDMRRYLAAILYNDGTRFDNNFNSLGYDFMVLFKQISYDKFKLITKYWISEVEKIAKKIDELLQNTVMIMTQMAYAAFEVQEKSVMWPILTKILVYQNRFASGYKDKKSTEKFVDNYTQWFIDTLGSIKMPSNQEIEQKSQIAKFCKFTDLSLITQNYRWLQSTLKQENDGGMRRHVGVRWYTQISYTSIWIAEVFTPFFEEAKGIFIYEEDKSDEKIDHPLYEKAKEFYTEVHNNVKQDFENLDTEDLNIMADVLSDVYQDKDLDKQKQQKARRVAEKLNSGYEIETILFLFEAANMELQIAYDQAPRKAKFQNIGGQTILKLTKMKRRLQEDIDAAYDKILRDFYFVKIEFTSDDNIQRIFNQYKNSPERDIRSLQDWCDKNIRKRFSNDENEEYTEFVQQMHETFLTYWEKVAALDKNNEKIEKLENEQSGKDPTKLQTMQTKLAILKNMKNAHLKRIFQFIWKNMLQEDIPTDVAILACIEAYQLEKRRARGEKNRIVQWFLSKNFPFDLPARTIDDNITSHDPQKVSAFVILLDDYIAVEEDFQTLEKECSDYIAKMKRARTWFRVVVGLFFGLWILATCYKLYAYASRPNIPRVCKPKGPIYTQNPEDLECPKEEEAVPYMSPEDWWVAPWNWSGYTIHSIFNNFGFFSTFLDRFRDNLELSGVKNIDASTFSLQRMLNAFIRGDNTPIGAIFWKTVVSFAKFSVISMYHIVDIFSVWYVWLRFDYSPQPDLDGVITLRLHKIGQAFAVEAAYFNENYRQLQQARRDAGSALVSNFWGWGGFAVATFVQGPIAVLTRVFGLETNSQNNQIVSENRQQYVSINDPNSNFVYSRPKIEVVEDEKQMVVSSSQQGPKKALPAPRVDEEWIKKRTDELQAALQESIRQLEYQKMEVQKERIRNDRLLLQIAASNKKDKEEEDEEDKEEKKGEIKKTSYTGDVD